MFGSKNYVNRLIKSIDVKELDNTNFKKKTEELKNNFSLDSAINLFFSVVKKKKNIYLYKEQIAGSLIMENGSIIEMSTGEGKTFVAILSAFINYLRGEQTKIITANDYLALRDATLAFDILGELGVRVGYIVQGQYGFVRRGVYKNSDIIYSRIENVVFDFLKDKTVKRKEDILISRFDNIIIDEVDTVLIDNATNPIYITGNKNDSKFNLLKIDKFVQGFKEGSDGDFEINKKNGTARLKNSGYKKLEDYALDSGWVSNKSEIYNAANSDLVYSVKDALVANFSLKIDEDYIIKNGKIKVIDKSTGRIIDSKSFDDGLEQAVQAKNKIEISKRDKVIGMITIQSFLNNYKKFSGMTGTIMTSKKEIKEVYQKKCFRIPRVKKSKKYEAKDLIFYDKGKKEDYLINLISKINKTGQPILIGTLSIGDTESIKSRLDEIGIEAVVLNAKNDYQEADIIKNAGRKNAVTIATNMAGRGTDIMLGGDKDYNEEWASKHKEVNDLGGLFVVGYERSLSRRIDNQLAGRCGRQGDRGTVLFMSSLEDRLIDVFDYGGVKKVFSTLRIKNDAVESKTIDNTIRRIQKQSEDLNFNKRKELKKYDDINQELREIYFQLRDEVLYKDNKKIVLNIFRKFSVSFINTNFVNNYDKKNWNEKELVYLLNRLGFKEDSVIKEIEKTFDNSDKEYLKGILLEALEKYTDDMVKKYGSNFYEYVVQQFLEYLNIGWGELISNLNKYKREAAISKMINKIPEQEYREMIFNKYLSILNGTNDFIYKLIMGDEELIRNYHLGKKSNNILNKNLESGITIGYISNTLAGT